MLLIGSQYPTRAGKQHALNGGAVTDIILSLPRDQAQGLVKSSISTNATQEMSVSEHAFCAFAQNNYQSCYFSVFPCAGPAQRWGFSEPPYQAGG